MQRMIVGVDGSSASLAALDWAAALARVVGAEVVAVNGDRPAQSEIRPARGEQLRAEQAARLRARCGHRLRVRCLPEPPRQA
jgi:nucleotide-binding universal stress UspA family protein